jgi:hypothetical protein
VQPTAQAGYKQSFSQDILRVTPIAQSEPDVVFAQNEVIQNFTNVTNIEFTAPINDTRTQNAETAQETSKIQNDAATQQRVPENAVNTTGGNETNIARPNNLVNEPQPEVSTTTTEESLKKKKTAAKQQRTLRPEQDNWNAINTTVGVGLIGAATYMFLK